MVKATGLDSQRHGNIEITEVLPAIDPDTEQAEPVSAFVFVTQKGLNEFAEGNGEDVKGDIKIKIVSGTASSFQPGSNIENLLTEIIRHFIIPVGVMVQATISPSH